MKINQPITEKEVVLRKGQTLVSRTNLKGIITFVDPDLIAISGFSEAELLNKNHNVVRHPDIPAEVFQDLWHTLKAGDPWVGIIKNRCKNGDYYWVEANVTPVYENATITGYLSVRRYASKEQISNAGNFYAAIRNGTTSMAAASQFSLSSTCTKMPLMTQLLIQLGSVIAMATLAVIADTAGNTTLAAISAIAGTGIICWLPIWFSRRVVHPLRNAGLTLQKLAEGKYFEQINIGRGDELGKLCKKIKSVQIKLGSDLDAANNKATDAGRIKQALDNVSTSVMVGDIENNIIYMNRSAQQLFADAEADIKTELPNFSATTVLGSNIDVFHKKPTHQRSMLSALDSSHTATVSIGGRILRIIANPVRGINGERLGTAVEWSDLTAEKLLENDVETVVSNALEGDLSRRIPLDDKVDFMATLSKKINQLMGVTERIFNDTVRVFSALSHGDLTETIDDNYSGLFLELKHDANNTVAKLAQIVAQLQKTAATVQAGSGEIAKGNANLSVRTEEQSANLEGTASSMEEINTTVRQNADNAAQANQLAQTALAEAGKGGAVVEQAVEAMSAINTSSNQIADIVGVIDEIAFQTNLLALNASVEAARAGEQGRGFAVVASEVRNLASRSATAAKEIKGLIQDSVVKVNDGSRLVNESGQMLEKIVEGIKNVTNIVGEITAASQEQAAGVDEVNKAITQIDGITQKNTSLVEQAAAASESLGHQAKDLRKLTHFFQTHKQNTKSSHVPANGEQRSAQRPWAKNNTAAPASGALDFSSARSKHLSWKTRLRSFLDGKESMTEAEAVSHRDCDLGKWLYAGAYKQFDEYEEMRELESIHAEMHSILRNIISQKHKGEEKLAEKNFTKIEPLSKKIIALLTQIEKISNNRQTTPLPLKAAANATAQAPMAASDEWDEF